jgi:hypothetical protein
MVEFSCPCGRRLKADNAAAGKTVRCRGCGKAIVVPHPGEVVALGVRLDEEDGREPVPGGQEDRGPWFVRGLLWAIALVSALVFFSGPLHDDVAEANMYREVAAAKFLGHTAEVLEREQELRDRRDSPSRAACVSAVCMTVALAGLAASHRSLAGSLYRRG